jgi:6-phosphogluconolactonase
LILLATTFVSELRSETLDVWLGTGRSPLSKGIYHCRFNTDDGKLTAPTLAAEMDGPGFLAMHPTLSVLYAVGGLKNDQVVAAFTIDKKNDAPTLKFVNAVPIGDGGAAHVSLDQTGRTLFTAQYGGGSLAVFGVNADGSIKERTQLIDHEGGSKAVEGRQDASHAHWTGVSPDNRFVFVPDLGLDQVVVYKFDARAGKVSPHGKGVLSPGSGPRHMKFHPNGKWIYVLNELGLTVTLFDYDKTAGSMSARQTIETVPADQLLREKAKSTSEIRIHPSGKFAYAANRGHDSISVFKVNETNGELTKIQVENVRGATPRNFNLTPDGNWLLAAGQLSNTLGVFSVDPASGMITYHQQSVFAPAAICVLFDKSN